jgi:hypothetical protein
MMLCELHQLEVRVSSRLDSECKLLLLVATLDFDQQLCVAAAIVEGRCR